MRVCRLLWRWLELRLLHQRIALVKRGSDYRQFHRGHNDPINNHSSERDRLIIESKQQMNTRRLQIGINDSDALSRFARLMADLLVSRLTRTPARVDYYRFSGAIVPFLRLNCSQIDSLSKLNRLRITRLIVIGRKAR